MNKMQKKNLDIEIRFVSDWDEKEIVNLYKAGKWWKDNYDSSSIRNLIKGSYKFAIVIKQDEGKAIGMGRLISDGISDAYIQDLVIMDEYRGKGLGKQLVKYLVSHCISKGISWIGLISEPGQDKFYSSLGFSMMKKHIPMKFNIDD
jgi:N-acetylglutamate synthase-like GNAT family acetyltransferase